MNAVEFFKSIANNVPRCSYHAKAMKEKLITYSRDLGYEVLEDDAGNLLARKHRHEKLALQSHYDIVCVGAQPPKLVEQDGWLLANGSSIGADNGAGIGLMMSLMQDYDELEYLFTNDEEVGLLGAKNLDLNLHARRLINFDGFTEGEIVIGCAGSIHLNLMAHSFEKMDIPDGYQPFKLSISGLAGGHSGLDIDKNIPNAILELAKLLKDTNALIVNFSGGEKLNSIPTKALATVWIDSANTSLLKDVSVEPLSDALRPFKDSSKLIDAILSIKNGVLANNSELGVVETSANVGILVQNEQGFCLDIFIRSMQNELQEKTAIEIASSWEHFGYEVVRLDSHTAWTPNMSQLALDLKVVMKPFYAQATFKAVHAGLECAIFYDKFSGMELASIGPNIRHAHSAHEKLEIASLERTESVVRAFLSSMDS
jgi:dipeptidase D